MLFISQVKNKRVAMISVLAIILIGSAFLLWQNYAEKRQIENAAYVDSWESIVMAIENCDVEQIFQAHSLAVSATLKDGRELKAVEPNIDDILDIAVNAQAKCGRILMATE